MCSKVGLSSIALYLLIELIATGCAKSNTIKFFTVCFLSARTSKLFNPLSLSSKLNSNKPTNSEPVQMRKRDMKSVVSKGGEELKHKNVPKRLEGELYQLSRSPKRSQLRFWRTDTDSYYPASISIMIHPCVILDHGLLVSL